MSTEDLLDTDVLDKASRLLRDQGWLPPVDMRWVNAPPRAKGAASLEDRAALRQLQENPGRWAIVGNYKYSSYAETWKRWGCETTIRKNHATGGIDLYARWPEEVGDPADLE